MLILKEQHFKYKLTLQKNFLSLLDIIIGLCGLFYIWTFLYKSSKNHGILIFIKVIKTTFQNTLSRMKVVGFSFYMVQEVKDFTSWELVWNMWSKLETFEIDCPTFIKQTEWLRFFILRDSLFDLHKE